MRRLPAVLLVSLFCAAGPLAAAEPAASQSPADAPTRVHLAPAGWEGSYHDIHYTPVLRIGDRVIVSGIPASEGADDEAKIRWAFQQLEAHLKRAGATLEDVVELNSFHVAQDHEEFRRRVEPVLKVHREFFKDHYPAWTAVGTTALFSKGAPMEIRAEAVIGSGRRARADIARPDTTSVP
ncbi:MAG: RidA family protein [Lysobacter sp.]|nr:RidA family protein [Lysobacter sp.]